MTGARGFDPLRAFCVPAAVTAMILGPSVRAGAGERPFHGETGPYGAVATAVAGDTTAFDADLPAIRTNDPIPGNERAKAQAASSAPRPEIVGASPDAVYSNLATFQNQSFAPGGATLQFRNTITRMAADDLNLVGTPPYSVNGFRFTVTNLNDVDVSARVLVRFYLPDGPGGGPGTLIAAPTYNPIVFTAGRVGTIKTTTKLVLPSSQIWAGIAFDNNAGATGATAAQLDNLALGIFSPPVLGTSADRYFVTTAAGSFASDNPVGTLADFGGAPPADFGWEILTAQNVDLSITNSDGVTTAFPGGSVTYTITASNAGPDTVFGARVADSFPASLTCSWTCAGSPGNTCAASGAGAINDAAVDLAAGGSVTYTANCAVSATATGTLVNTATVFAPGTAVDADTANDSATDTDTIAAIGPPTITKAFGPLAILVNGTTALTFTLGNPNPGVALSGVGFTDTLPAGLAVATPNGLASTCGGTVNAVAGAGSIGLASGALPAGGSCAITVHVSGATIGVKRNTTSAVTSTEGGTGRTASAFLVVVSPPVVEPPTIAKSFGVANLPLNGTTTLTIALANPDPEADLSGVGFTDTLPAGLVVATPNGLTNTCVGTVTAAAGAGSVALAGGGLPVGGACAITVDVTGTTAGVKDNTTSAVTSTEGGTGGTASASLTVIAPPTIAKAFGEASIVENGTTTLTFSLANPNPGTALSGLGFTDALPPGLVVATPSGLSSTCGGTADAAAGGSSISLGGGTLPVGGACAITVHVASTTAGVKNNTTSAVASAEGGAGGTASATLTVTAGVMPPTIAKAFGPPGVTVGGTTTLTFTLTNPNAETAVSGVGFIDPLPAGLTVTNAARATCGGAVTTSGGNTIVLAGAAIAPAETCTLSVLVTAITGGLKNNVSSAVTSTEGGTGGAATASLVVVAPPTVAPPTIAKAFGTASIEMNGTTTLTFTLTNPNAGAAALSGVGFTDVLPSGLAVASGASATCGGTLTASGGTTIALAGATITAGGTCTFSVTVTGTSAGAKNNTTGAVGSTEGGAGGTATASLVVLAPPAVAPPTIAKYFGTHVVALNQTLSLTFTLTNPNPGSALTGIGFTDALPAGLVVATPNGLTGACGGRVVVVDGGTTLVLADGGLPPGGSCTITVDVTGVTVGRKVNTTSAVTSTEGGTGGTASAFLTVTASPIPIPTVSFEALALLALLLGGAGALLFSRLR